MIYNLKKLPIVILIFWSFIPLSQDFSTAGFYQTDSEIRKAMNFNVGWRFIKKDVQGAEKVDYDDSSWAVVNLPHGLEILPLAASGGINYQGPAWYRNILSLIKNSREKK